MARRFQRRGKAPFDRARNARAWRVLLVLLLLGAFIITPFFLVRSIIYLEPAQGAMLLALFLLAVLLALPLSRREVGTRWLAWALIAYVGFDILWADYVAVDLPFLPLLTPVKIFLLTLCGVWLFLAATTHTINDRIWQAAKTLPVLTAALAVLFVFQLLAVPYSLDPSNSTVNMINYLTFYYVPFFIAATTIKSRGQIELLLKVMVIGAGIVAAIVVFESMLQKNLYVMAFGKWINYQTSWLAGVFKGAERPDGRYRALGSFVSYLSLADYMVLSLPFTLYFFEKSKKLFVRAILLVVAVLSAYAILAADSRTAMMCLFVLAVCYALLKAVQFIIRNPRSTLRPIVGLVLVGTVLAAPLGAYVMFNKLQGWNTFGGGYSTRTMMFKLGAYKLAHRPIIGYGPGQSGEALNWRPDGKNMSIDSYYLSMALDAGLPGLAAFSLLPATLIWVALRRARRRTEDERLFLAFALSGLGFALVRVTTSQYENVNFFYVLLGAFVALLLLIRQESAPAEEKAMAGEQAMQRLRRGRMRVGETGVFARFGF